MIIHNNSFIVLLGPLFGLGHADILLIVEVLAKVIEFVVYYDARECGRYPETRVVADLVAAAVVDAAEVVRARGRAQLQEALARDLVAAPYGQLDQGREKVESYRLHRLVRELLEIGQVQELKDRHRIVSIEEPIPSPFILRDFSVSQGSNARQTLTHEHYAIVCQGAARTQLQGEEGLLKPDAYLLENFVTKESLKV